MLALDPGQMLERCLIGRRDLPSLFFFLVNLTHLVDDQPFVVLELLNRLVEVLFVAVDCFEPFVADLVEHQTLEFLPLNVICCFLHFFNAVHFCTSYSRLVCFLTWLDTFFLIGLCTCVFALILFCTEQILFFLLIWLLTK